MNILPNADKAVIPEEKLINYALSEEKNFDKATAFKQALGYDKTNFKELMNVVMSNLKNFNAKEMPDLGYGQRYQVIMKIKGPNGKTANVLTAWIEDNQTKQMRLTSIYVVDKIGGDEHEALSKSKIKIW